MALVSSADLSTLSPEAVVALIPRNCDKDELEAAVQHVVAAYASMALPPAEIAERQRSLILASKQIATNEVRPIVRSGSRLFDSRIDINDLSNEVRQEIVRKGGLQEVSEFTGVTLTVRGVYVPAGKRPPPGFPRLTLHVESGDAERVSRAHAEIRRMIRALEASSAPEHRAPVRAVGRYTL